MILPVLQTLVFPGFLFLIAVSFLYEWLDRKIYAWMQLRAGPALAGPVGIMQPIADFVKLMGKEDITPAYADRRIFGAVPVLMVALILTFWAVVPVTGAAGLVSFRGDVVFAVVAMTFFCMLIFLGGFSSSDRFSLLGAERAVLQLLGFEIPLMLSITGVCIHTGGLSVSEIVSWQAENGWSILGPQAMGFFIFLVAAQAELERIPFDIPEAEQEIVAGWLTEYSGRKLALIRLAKDMELVFISGLAVALFLGGPIGPSHAGLEWLLYPAYFLLKLALVVAVLALVRGLFARVRIDQMVSFGMRYLVPLSLAQVAATILWRLI
ncbi:MAG: complex I subunit 1/NuoH family protein [Candidatus Methanosuratincola sp.]|nr:NADH-quinone oxidoreductase subunit H [Candidatus Methanosuratincola sp.]